MRLRLVAWLTALAVLGAAVPCGASAILGPDCCAGQAGHAMPAGHDHGGEATRGHASHAGRAGHAAAGPHRAAPAPAGAITAAASGRRSAPSPMPTGAPECCLAAPEGRSDDAPRVTVSGYVLAAPIDAVPPYAGLESPARPPLPRAPLPPRATPLHVLLSTFLI